MEHYKDVLHIKDVLQEILGNINSQKSVFTFSEGCKYCGISQSSMYKHTSSNKIPYYKPEGKLIFFKKGELDDWLLRNRQSTVEELERKASTYSISKK
jgi:excisionase family DNA binding protein